MPDVLWKLSQERAKVATLNTKVKRLERRLEVAVTHIPVERRKEYELAIRYYPL